MKGQLPVLKNKLLSAMYQQKYEIILDTMVESNIWQKYEYIIVVILTGSALLTVNDLKIFSFTCLTNCQFQASMQIYRKQATHEVTIFYICYDFSFVFLLSLYFLLKYQISIMSFKTESTKC